MRCSLLILYLNPVVIFFFATVESLDIFTEELKLVGRRCRHSSMDNGASCPTPFFGSIDKMNGHKNVTVLMIEVFVRPPAQPTL